MTHQIFQKDCIMKIKMPTFLKSVLICISLIIKYVEHFGGVFHALLFERSLFNFVAQFLSGSFAFLIFEFFVCPLYESSQRYVSGDDFLQLYELLIHGIACAL